MKILLSLPTHAADYPERWSTPRPWARASVACVCRIQCGRARRGFSAAAGWSAPMRSAASLKDRFTTCHSRVLLMRISGSPARSPKRAGSGRHRLRQIGRPRLGGASTPVAPAGARPLCRCARPSPSFSRSSPCPSVSIAEPRRDQFAGPQSGGIAEVKALRGLPGANEKRDKVP